MQPEISALMNGLQRGNRQALQGITPSAQNAGGAAPAAIDPMGAQLAMCHRQIMSAIAQLHKTGADQDASKLMKCAETVLNVALDRRKRIAKGAVDNASGQGDPTRLHAMGSNVSGY